MNLIEEIDEYLKKIRTCADMCHLCGRSRKQILKTVKKIYAYDDIFSEMLGDKVPVIMTYDLSRPVCALCYNTIKDRSELAQEVRKSKTKDVWKNATYLFKECYISDPLGPIQLRLDM